MTTGDAVPGLSHLTRSDPSLLRWLLVAPCRTPNRTTWGPVSDLSGARVAARESDRLDVVDLLRRCGSQSVADVDDLVADMYDGERLNERQRGWIEDIIATIPSPDIDL